MAALPVIQKVEQGLATRIANGVSAFFGPTDAGASGQKVPSHAASSSANTAQSSSTLSNSVANALLQLQDAGSSQIHGHHHHQGAGKYKAASDMLSQLTGASGSTSSTSGASSAVTA